MNEKLFESLDPDQKNFIVNLNKIEYKKNRNIVKIQKMSKN